MKIMDIFTNWRKGKKEHDARVLRVIPPPPPPRVSIGQQLFAEIEKWGGRCDRQIEAKHWQILAEYAQDQVKELTKENGDVLPTEESNAKSTFDPRQDQYIAIWGRTTSPGSSENKSILDKAEERHGFTMSKE